MTNERTAFEAQYGPLGADLAHNYERGYLNPMTRELFACWCAALASRVQEPVAWATRGFTQLASAVDKAWMERCEFGQWKAAAANYTIPLYAVPLAAGEPQPDSVHLTERSGEAATGREDASGASAPADVDAWARARWPEYQLHDNGKDTPLMVLIRDVWDAASGVQEVPRG